MSWDQDRSAQQPKKVGSQAVGECQGLPPSPNSFTQALF